MSQPSSTAASLPTYCSTLTDADKLLPQCDECKDEVRTMTDTQYLSTLQWNKGRCYPVRAPDGTTKDLCHYHLLKLTDELGADTEVTYTLDRTDRSPQIQQEVLSTIATAPASTTDKELSKNVFDAVYNSALSRAIHKLFTRVPAGIDHVVSKERYKSSVRAAIEEALADSRVPPFGEGGMTRLELQNIHTASE